ncbi:N-acetyltransferase, partial [Micrococcus endophyticus]
PTAVAMAADWAFRSAGLHRVEVNIRPENAASLRVVEKLGLRDEGVRRSYLHVDGDWRDHRTFAITAGEVPEGLLARWLASR